MRIQIPCMQCARPLMREQDDVFAALGAVRCPACTIKRLIGRAFTLCLNLGIFAAFVVTGVEYMAWDYLTSTLVCGLAVLAGWGIIGWGKREQEEGERRRRR